MYINKKSKTSFKAKDKNSWNKKASSMNKNIHTSIYNNSFLNLINFDGLNSCLDIGCGVGNLSLLLAKKMKSVHSLDFSSSMLECLEKNVKEKNITNITSINDSWESVPKADLVIASRSMEVKDMKQALEKLNSYALKKVVLSYQVGGSFITDEVLEILNVKISKKPDYIYIINISYNMGINASLNFIKSEGRNTKYTSYEDFLQSIIWSLGSLSQTQKKFLENYYLEHIKNTKQMNDYVTWGVISWNKKQ